MVGRASAGVLSLALLALVLCAGSVSAEWTLKFTERDVSGGYTNSYKDYANLSILVDDNVVASYDTIGGDYNYGAQSIDLTPYVVEGKSRVSFRLDGILEGVLLKDIDILHDGKPVRFSPWALEKSDERVRGFDYSDSRLVIMLGEDLQERENYGQFSSQPLTDAPELELKQSDLTFSKPIYDIADGDEVEANVTVRNLGSVRQDKARIDFLVDDALSSSSDEFPLQPSAAPTKTFKFKAAYNGKKYVKIEAKVVPSGDAPEGKSENNHAVKYILKRPSMLFADINQTYFKNHLSESPYSDWYSELELKSKECMGIDYSDKELQENAKSACLMDMALYYQLTGDETYASRAVDGLTHIGDGNWAWADRSKAGSAAKGSLDKGVDENYGLDNVYGKGWGQVMVQNALAYDWINDYAVQSDRKQGTNSTNVIRDKIARMATDSYLLLKEIYSYGDHGTGISAFAFGDYGTGRLAIESPFGVAAMSILDYDGQYQDLDGNPDEWLKFVEKDLAVESQTGAKLPNLDQHMSADGLYEEGEGYRDYYEPGLSTFVGLYNNVMGVNMAKKYDIVDGSMNDIPLMMSPPGRYPNICVSYGGVWSNIADSLMVYGNDSPQRSLINYYINDTVLHNRGYRQMGGQFGLQDLMLLYDSSESKQLPREPSYFSPHGSVNILRSGFGRDALYSFVKAPNEPTMSGHAPYHYHQLTFDIWAKGAYMVVDAGDERYLGYGGSSIYGHTTWLFYEDGSERWIDRDAKGQYGQTCKNPAYITSAFASDEVDYLRGQMNVSEWYNYPNAGKVKHPFQVSRDVVLVGDNYFIVADTLSSNGSNSYSMLIPFGSADGHVGAAADPSDNWALGNLSINGERRDWFDYAAKKPINSHFPNASELTWATLTETNDIESVPHPAKMTVFMNPSADVDVNVSGMHYGDYGEAHEWAFPYARVNQGGRDVKYLTVYYPTAEGEDLPSMRRIQVNSSRGGGYATKIISPDYADTVILGGGLSSTGDMVSDAELTLERESNGTPVFLFLAGGYGFKRDNTTLFYSSAKATALVKYGPKNVSAKITTSGPSAIYLRSGFDPKKGVKYALYNGKPADYAYDGFTLSLNVSGSGDVSAEATDADAPASSGASISVPDLEENMGYQLVMSESAGGTNDSIRVGRYALDAPAGISWVVLALVGATALALLYFYVRKTSS